MVVPQPDQTVTIQHSWSSRMELSCVCCSPKVTDLLEQTAFSGLDTNGTNYSTIGHSGAGGGGQTPQKHILRNHNTVICRIIILSLDILNNILAHFSSTSRLSLNCELLLLHFRLAAHSEVLLNLFRIGFLKVFLRQTVCRSQSNQTAMTSDPD